MGRAEGNPQQWYTWGDGAEQGQQGHDPEGPFQLSLFCAPVISATPVPRLPAVPQLHGCHYRYGEQFLPMAVWCLKFHPKTTRAFPVGSSSMLLLVGGSAAPRLRNTAPGCPQGTEQGGSGQTSSLPLLSWVSQRHKERREQEDSTRNTSLKGASWKVNR